MVNKQKATIIGAGIGGMALASLLARKGLDVTIVEKNAIYGGRGRVLKANGFVFDMGPSWYLLPEIFEDFFQLFGKSTSDYYDLVPLDPAYRIFLSENRTINISRELEQNLKTFAGIEKDGDVKFKKYLEKSKEIYDVVVGKLFYEDLTSKKVMISPKVRKEFLKLNIRDMLGSYEDLCNKYFESEDLKRIIQHGVALLGSHPKHTPGLFAMMTHADYNLGVSYPVGGMGKLFSALYTLSKELGVKYEFNFDVEKILTKKGLASGVVSTENKKIVSDFVVSNADYAFTELDLLPEKHRTYKQDYWEKKDISPSAFIIYLGVDKRLPQLLYHNLFLDRDWRDHFEGFYGKDKSWPEKPAYYVCCPSREDDGLAPEGCENLFITIPVASGLEDTPEIRRDFFDSIIKHMEKRLDTNLRSHLIYKKIFTLNDFSNDYHAYQGTALGMSNILTQSSIFRVNYQSNKLDNLFYVGQYVHPGAGMSSCIASARIVADKINI